MIMLCISTKTEADFHENEDNHDDYSGLERSHHVPKTLRVSHGDTHKKHWM